MYFLGKGLDICPIFVGVLIRCEISSFFLVLQIILHVRSFPLNSPGHAGTVSMRYFIRQNKNLVPLCLIPGRY